MRAPILQRHDDLGGLLNGLYAGAAASYRDAGDEWLRVLAVESMIDALCDDANPDRRPPRGRVLCEKANDHRPRLLEGPQARRLLRALERAVDAHLAYVALFDHGRDVSDAELKQTSLVLDAAYDELTNLVLARPRR